MDLDNFFINNYLIDENFIILYGYQESSSSSMDNPNYPRIAMLNTEGDILWDITSKENGFSRETIESVLLKEDGISVISRGDHNFLCLTTYDMFGNLKTFTKNELGNFGIWVVAELDTGYLIQLGTYTTGEYLVKMNWDGTLSDTFSYASEEKNVFISDMIEQDDNIYLSVYLTPSFVPDDTAPSYRSEILSILNYIYNYELFDISNDELTKLVRANYTAMLLVCDTKSGIPQEFLSVDSSLGGKLSINDSGTLSWEVEDIADTFYSMETSSFCIGGWSNIYRYTLDETGKLLNQEKLERLQISENNH